MSTNGLRFFLVFSATFLSGAGFSLAEVRTWTNQEGRKIQAELSLFNQENGTVTLRMAGGKQHTVPLSSLSQEDVAFLTQQKRPGLGAAPVREPGGGLALFSGWNIKVKGEELKAIYGPHVPAAADLTPDPKVEIYGGVHYLDSLDDAKRILFKGDLPFEVRTLVSTQGFPHKSISYYSYDKSPQAGFGHTAIITDAAQQVVGIQFLNNVPPAPLPIMHTSEWHYFNFLQNRKKGATTYQIAHQLVGVEGPNEQPVFLPWKKGERIDLPESTDDTLVLVSGLVDGSGKAREWLLLILPKKYIGVMLSVLE